MIWDGLSCYLSSSKVKLSFEVFFLKNKKNHMMSFCTTKLKFLPMPYISRLGKPSTYILLVYVLSFIKFYWPLWEVCHTLKIKITYTPLKYALLKALVWFWWIDETLGTNLCALSEYEIGQVHSKWWSKWWRSWWWWWSWWWSRARTWKRRKRKTKWVQGKGEMYRAILFWWSRHLVGVITFRIDGRTIKRGETRIEMRLSKCH
jgi:hypothetical protein